METKLRIDFNEIINLIENRRQNAYKKINEELILLYWDFGKYISNKINNDKWGSKVVDSLVIFIKEKYPTLKGFNRAGIYRMEQFYEVYKNYPEIVSTLLRQWNWSSHIQILSGTKTLEERKFYMELAIKEKYTTRELSRQIESGYYQRYMISGKNISNNQTLFINNEKIPNTRFLDTYSLDFINLPEDYKEIDLRKAIISNLKKFILEIGKSFTFIGEEYRIQVGNEDFYTDLLFYNRELSCLVAFELKIGKFIPEYISKLFYALVKMKKLSSIQWAEVPHQQWFQIIN